MTTISETLISILSPPPYSEHSRHLASFVTLAFSQFGTGKPADRIEELRRLNLFYLQMTGVDDIVKEEELMRTKWFDYRYLHPVEATQVVVNCWTAKYQHAWAKYRNSEEAHTRVGVSHDTDPKSLRRNWNMFFHLRQRIDALGLHYSPAIGEAFETKCDLGWSHSILPSQLLLEQYSYECERAAEQQQGNPVNPYPTLQIFWDEFYRGDAAQRAVKYHALNIIRYYAVNRDKAAARLLGCQPILNESEIRQEFGDELIEQAKRAGWVGDIRKNMDDATVQQLTQSCFGIPGLADRRSTACSSCVNFERCEDTARRDVATLADIFKTETPALDRKREQARLRKRRQRAREASDINRTVETASLLP